MLGFVHIRTEGPPTPTFLKELVYHRLSRGGLRHAELDAGIDSRLTVAGEVSIGVQVEDQQGCYPLRLAEMLMGPAGRWICTPGLNRR